MNIKETKESLDYLFKAQLTPFLWSHAGMGKTSLVKQHAKEKGFKFFAFYLGTQSDTGDVLGLANFVKNDNGTESTEFAKPKWMHDTIEYCLNNPESGAIIFFDEFNRARKDMLSGMFSLTLDKKFHTVEFPENCYFIAAGNPPTDEYFTTDINETALMARFVHIKLEPTVDEWLEYAKNKEINNNIIEFIRQQPALIEQKHTDFDLSSMVKVDRRSQERWSNLIRTGIPDYLLFLLLPGIIGIERTVAYQKFLKETEKPLTAEDVLSGKNFHLLEKWSNTNNVMSSFLNVTRENIENYFKDLNDKCLKLKNYKKKTLALDKKESKNLMQFFKIIPLDIAYPLIKKLVEDSIGTELTPFKMSYAGDKEQEDFYVDLVMRARGANEK